MGFASGLKAGSSVAGEWISTYKKGKEEQLTNEAMALAHDITQGRQQQNAEGAEIDNTIFKLDNATTGDLSEAMIQKLTMNGGKVDDQAYRIIYGVSEQFIGMRDKYKLFQQKEKVQRARENDFENKVYNRDRLTESRVEKNGRNTNRIFTQSGDDMSNDNSMTTIDEYGMQHPVTEKDNAKIEVRNYFNKTAKSLGMKPQKNGRYRTADEKKIMNMMQKDRPDLYEYIAYTPPGKKGSTKTEAVDNSTPVSTKDKSKWGTAFEHKGFWYEFDDQGMGTKSKI